MLMKQIRYHITDIGGFNQARYREAVQRYPTHFVDVTKKTKGAAQTFEKVSSPIPC